ncbi:MAG: DNA-3-methyladenine glycosylase 2 family protein [Sphingobacteriales bacterium]|nr:MAG: DNA-3-methyladenine glycosylase 2 family protein [Sphingobacteriales bacterium]
MSPSSTPHWSVSGTSFLKAADPVLGTVIDRIELNYTPQVEPDLYAALVRSVLGQQISVKAAAAIWQRFHQHFATGTALPPEAILAEPDDTFRTLGLSRQKTTYVKAISQFAIDGHLALAEMQPMTAEALTAHLTQIKGVGPWTAEMIQMFALDRPDVFSAGDLGIQNAMRRLYDLPETGKALHQRMQQLADRWRPYRTLACRYLWKSLDLPAGASES